MHARLKNEFTEDEKYHNLMRWLKLSVALNITFVKYRIFNNADTSCNMALFPFAVVGFEKLQTNILSYKLRQLMSMSTTE